MAISRNKSYQALFDRVKRTMPDVQFFSRKFMDYTQVPQMPAVLVIPVSQKPTQKAGYPAEWILSAMVFIYCKTPRVDDPQPDKELLDLIDQLETSLERTKQEPIGFGESVGQFQSTLGGAVLRVWISGTVEVYQGAEGEQAVALIPVEMLATA